MVSDALVSTASISDRGPIYCSWSFKLPRRLSEGHDTSIESKTSFENVNDETESLVKP